MTRKPKRVARYIVKRFGWFSELLSWCVIDTRDADGSIVAAFRLKASASKYANMLNGNGVK